MAKYRVFVCPQRSGNFQLREVNKDGIKGKRGTLCMVDKYQEMWVECPITQETPAGKKLLRGKSLANWIAERAVAKKFSGDNNGIIEVTESMEQLKDAFLKDCRGENLSPNTVNHYFYDINKALEYMEWEYPAWLTEDLIRKYRNDMFDDEYANETVRGNLSGLRAFLSYLVREKKLAKSPFTESIMPQPDEKEPRYYTALEYMKLREALVKICHPAAILCSLAHGSGLRKCEAVGHREGGTGVLWEDITWTSEGKAMLLLRKECVKGGARSRSVPLNAETIALIGSRRSGPLVTISRVSADHYFERAREIAGINPDLTIHGLRHTFAKNELQDGNVSLFELQRLMGHANSKTTDIYAQFEKSHYHKGVDLAHERQKEKEAVHLAGRMQDDLTKIIELGTIVGNNGQQINKNESVG